MGREKITPDNHYKKELKDHSHSFFVIAAEGEEQEPKYFELLKRKYQDLFQNKLLQIEVLHRPEEQEHDSSPISVRRMIEEFLEHNGFDYSKIEDIRTNDIYCLVIDTDKWKAEHFEQLSIWCKGKQQFNLMISNPCFELWLILHISILSAELKEELEKCKIKDRSTTTKSIWNRIKPQLKTVEVFEAILPIENLKLAVERATTLDTNPHEDYPIDFMTTKVYQVIEKMGLLDEIQKKIIK